MSGCGRKSFQPSLPLKLEEQAASPKVSEKQGIVSILGSDCERTKAASLRRTLSADMSSKKWLAQNGFRPMKKIASSEELAISTADHLFSSSSSEDEYEGNKDELQRPGQDEVWRSIQSQKEKNEVEKPHGWTWGSILTQKNEESNELQIPYIHPLMKRSTSSLSEKSLEICTESLGSETGSDGFSSYPPSEAGDVDEEKEDGQQQLQQQSQSEAQSLEDLQFVKYNYSPNRKMLPRSFPPPLPSLAREDGASLHMHCHRQNGRLVLEAVSVPSQNYLHAQRLEGRLLLTLVNNPSSQEARNEEMEDEAEEYTQVFDNIEEEMEGNEAEFEDDGYEIEDEEDEEDFEELMEEKFEKENSKRSEMEFVIEQNSKFPGGGMINVHKSALVMKRLMALDNKNLTWSPKFNKAVNLIGVEEEEEVEEELTQLPQSLPPPPRVGRLISTATPATAASFNAYEYFWRQKPRVASIIKQIPEQCTPLKNNQNKAIRASNLKGYEQQNLVVMRGNKAEYLLPLLRRCNEPRRSLLLWEPYCIATS